MPAMPLGTRQTVRVLSETRPKSDAVRPRASGFLFPSLASFAFFLDALEYRMYERERVREEKEMAYTGQEESTSPLDPARAFLLSR